jgi:hypothetical protein
MKSNISIPTLLTIIVIAGIIALIPLSPLPLSASSDSDESETNADQRLKQKNLGSGESSDFNCDENMITSGSGTECIPSGPAPPTPPPPPPTPDVVFTITGFAQTGFLCEGAEPAIAEMTMDATGLEDGTVTGEVIITVLAGGPQVSLAVTGGTTDGNTFSLSGESGFCSEEPFTITGDCGSPVDVRYEDPNGTGDSSAGDVACTLL